MSAEKNRKGRTKTAETQKTPAKRGRPKGNSGNHLTRAQKEEIATRRVERKIEKFENDEHNFSTLMAALQVASSTRVDFNDPEAVKRRIVDYFTFCDQQDMRCSVAGIAASLGIDRRRLHEARTGQIPHGFKEKVPKETIEMIDFAYSVYEQWLEDAMLRGAVHPVASIFLLKCNSGYQEEQKVIVQNENPLGEIEDAQKIAERYQNIVE